MGFLDGIENANAIRHDMLYHSLKDGEDITPFLREGEQPEQFAQPWAKPAGLSLPLAAPHPDFQDRPPPRATKQRPSIFASSRDLPAELQLGLSLAAHGKPGALEKVANKYGFEVGKAEGQTVIVDPKAAAIYDPTDLPSWASWSAETLPPVLFDALATRGGGKVAQKLFDISRHAKRTTLGEMAGAAGGSVVADQYHDLLRRYYGLEPVADPSKMSINAGISAGLEGLIGGATHIGGHAFGARAIRDSYPKELRKAQEEYGEAYTKGYKETLEERQKTAQEVATRSSQAKSRYQVEETRFLKEDILPEMLLDDVQRQLKVKAADIAARQAADVPVRAAEYAEFLNILKAAGRAQAEAGHQGVKLAVSKYPKRKINRKELATFFGRMNGGPSGTVAQQLFRRLRTDRMSMHDFMAQQDPVVFGRWRLASDDEKAAIEYGILKWKQLPKLEHNVSVLEEFREKFVRLTDLDLNPNPGDIEKAKRAIARIDRELPQRLPKKSQVGEAVERVAIAEKDLGNPLFKRLEAVDTPRDFVEELLTRKSTKYAKPFIEALEASPGARDVLRRHVLDHLLGGPYGPQTPAQVIKNRLFNANEDVLDLFFKGTFGENLKNWKTLVRNISPRTARDADLVRRLKAPKWSQQVQEGMEAFLRSQDEQTQATLLAEAKKRLSELPTPKEAAANAVADLATPERTARDAAIETATMKGMFRRILEWRWTQVALSAFSGGAGVGVGYSLSGQNPSARASVGGLAALGAALTTPFVWASLLENPKTAEAFFHFATETTNPREAGRNLGIMVLEGLMGNRELVAGGIKGARALVMEEGVRPEVRSDHGGY